MQEKILLSIIVPAYNAEKTIGRLIDSIVSQKYDNYELIILNDGSKDNTYKVISEYAKKYENVIAIDKINTGVSDTRNEGLKIAKGKYIVFADADDYYSNVFFQEIIPEIKKENFELLVFNANVMNYEEIMYDLIPKKYKSGIFIEKYGLQKYLQGEFCHKIGNVPWNKVYINEIIKKNKIVFNTEKKYGEDLLFNLIYTSKITKYNYFNKNLYNYCLNMNTTTTTVYREREINENIKFYKPIRDICINNKMLNYEQFIGLFFLRRFPGIVLNETNNDNYLIGKQNIKNYLKNKQLKDSLKKIKLKKMDLKLLVCYVFYKFKCYNIIYSVMWQKKHK